MARNSPSILFCVACLSAFCSLAAPAAAVAGRVIGEGGVPIRGASIQAWPADIGIEVPEENEAPIAGVSDRTGGFLLTGMEPGKYRIAVAADGHVPREMANHVVAEQEADPLLIELAPAVFVAGKVVDASNATVANARLETKAGDGRAIAARTDADGRFRLGPFARGDKAFVDVFADAAGAALDWEIVAPSHGLRIEIRRRGTLRGHVLEANSGWAIDDFRIDVVEIVPTGRGARETRRFQSAEGRFEWPGLQSGLFMVQVSADGYQLYAVPEVAVPAGGASDDLSILLAEERVIRGRVAHAVSGLPIASATVTARPGSVPEPYSSVPMSRRDAGRKPFGSVSATTDDDGMFVLGRLPPEAVAVRVHAAGYVPQSIVVAHGGDDAIEIGLFVAASVSGRLLGRDGASVQGTVWLWSPAALRHRVAATAADGSFEIAGVIPGRYRIGGAPATDRGVRPGDWERAGQALQVPANEAVDNIEVHLAVPEDGSLRGRVHGLSSGEDATVRLLRRAEDGSNRRRLYGIVAVDEQGRYEVLGTRAGKFVVEVRTSAGREAVRRIELAAAEDATLDFQLRGNAVLSGTVTRLGKPVRVLVRATPAPGEGAQGSAWTSRTGQYALYGLEHGSYDLQVDWPQGQSFRVEVAGDTRFDVQLQGSTLAGVVREHADKSPLAGVFVQLKTEESASQPSRQALTDRRGSFSFHNLDPASYRLFIHKTGYEPALRVQDVSETAADLSISLERASGGIVRIRDAETNQPVPSVAVSVRDGEIFLMTLPLMLGADGSAPLPRELVGRDLTFLHPHYQSVKVERWNGAPLDIEMVLR